MTAAIDSHCASFESPARPRRGLEAAVLRDIKPPRPPYGELRMKYSQGRHLPDGRKFPSFSVIILNHGGAWSSACRAAGLTCGGTARPRWQRPVRFDEECIRDTVKEFLHWAAATPTITVPSRGAYSLWREQTMKNDPSRVGKVPSMSTIHQFCRARRTSGVRITWRSFVYELYADMEGERSKDST
ncbi:hypothetical protein CYMTET_20923 [Cymbomonas tetramitiformis]|uniref:Uncharacterized protein n=1 Tax=Cymbomonas tetramitiformis TaxID=36881 RepID=A0AAE0G333_9CHLO|nr:hypothetical protein CYMTET_20923 [Cymbomonas tetramitiformis]